MSIQTGITEQNASAPDRGILEVGVPCDLVGDVGVVGIHTAISFIDRYTLLGMPQAIASSPDGAIYYSLIHGGGGSDVRNFNATDGGNGQIVRPAFANPGVTTYATAGVDLDNEKKNGYLNTEKVLRAPTDVTAPAGPTSGNIWVPTNKTKLSFQFWLNSLGGGTVHQFTLQVFRDINRQDKVVNVFGGAVADPQNAQLIYQYGPFYSVPFGQPEHNCQAVDIPMAAGCNIYIIVRNISNNLSTNQMLGSVRFT